MADIKFGTSGWRAIIADDFTFDNVRIVSHAVALYLKSIGSADQGLVVGYDRRFLSDRFALTTALVLARDGIPVYYTTDATPTPTIGYESVRRGTAGSVNITASHNPPEWNGIKFSPYWGGQATDEITGKIERFIGEIMESGETPAELEREEAEKRGLFNIIDPRSEYLSRIKELIRTDVIRSAGLKVIVDPMHGAAVGYLDELLAESGCDVQLVHSEINPGFGGKPPEPNGNFLADTIEAVRRSDVSVALCLDGDGDRFGIIDADGTFIEPNYVLAILLQHLVERRGWRGEVVKNVATTHLLNRLADKYGIPVCELPVGFKHLGKRMVDNPDALMAGEGSAGFALRGHVPDKDGIVACMLVAEAIAETGKTLTELLEGIYADVGRLRFREERIKSQITKDDFYSKIDDVIPDRFAGARVIKIDKTDGLKFLLEDGSWLGMRPSGTEPIIRCYMESDSEERIQSIYADAREMIDRIIR